MLGTTVVVVVGAPEPVKDSGEVTPVLGGSPVAWAIIRPRGAPIEMGGRVAVELNDCTVGRAD